jgi:hypothetical protein
MQRIVDWLPYGLAVIGLAFLALALWRRRRGGARLLTAACAGVSLTTAVVLIGLDRADADRRDRAAAAGPAFDWATAYGGPAGPAVGTPAPDFTLPRVDTGEPVHLSELAHHGPVVLVFGEFG